ncbi:MAG: CRISPR-associated helicase Cas3' [Thermomicrobiales bacterium]
MLYAHTPNEDGEWHALACHLQDVAELAEKHAAAFGSGNAAWWAGILHDSGKAGVDFQRYLALCAEQPDRRHQTIDHKGAGFLRVIELMPELAFLVQGHHGGLIDAGEMELKGTALARRAPALQETLERFDALGVIPQDRARPEIPEFAQTNRHALEFWLRMLFSALVDADHFDTERHWHPEVAAQRGSEVTIQELWERFAADQAAFIAQLSPQQQAMPVNQVRGEVYAACMAAAEQESGFFRLTVPTGGGKTRSGLGFALRHATRNGLRRVILAVPYLTITDQTARIVRSIFPDDRVVLEHHSAADAANDDEAGSQDEHAQWRRLAAQDWNAPLIITTMVQLFESLLGRKTSVCRKLHRIAGSVIVLDEAQTIPLELREPIYDVLRELVANYGVTVVLCTATQPAVDWLPVELAPVEIVSEPARHFRALQRVDYVWPQQDEAPWNWERAAEEMRTNEQALAIVNTVADAAALFDALGEGVGHFHLSSRMCGAHRRDVVDLVRGRLRAGLPCRLVSTQVVEAGVDLDFPLLLRAFGPLDRIVQAAGRCNREGRLPRGGRVVIFRPEEGGTPPGPYRISTEATGNFLEWEGDALDLNDPALFDRYFRSLYRDIPGDSKGIQQERQSRNFRTVEERFRMIDNEDQVPVLARYRGLDRDPYDNGKPASEKLADSIQWAVDTRNSKALRALIREAQPFLVNVRRNWLTAGDTQELTDDVLLWLPEYDNRLGLVSGRMDVERLIVG